MRSTRTPEQELAEAMQPFMQAMASKYALEEKVSSEVFIYNFRVKFPERFPGFQPDSARTPSPELQKIMDLLPKKNLTFGVSGNNNLNVFVTNPENNARVVVQFSKKNNTEVDNMLYQDFKESSTNYAEPIRMPIPNSNTNKVKPFNKNNNDQMIMARCTEYSRGSLTSIAEGKSEQEKLALAVMVFPKVSAFLEQLYNKEIIWSDLKSDNLLLRNNNSIIVPDTKGFSHKDDTYLFYNARKQFIPGLQTTDNMCSTAIGRLYSIPADVKLEITDAATNARQTLKEEWAKEYNYQLGVMLYQVLTGEVKFNDTAYDFELPVFKNTDAGKKFAELITELSKDIPDERMTHQNVTRTLKTDPAFADIQKALKEEIIAKATQEKTARENEQALAKAKAETEPDITKEKTASIEPQPDTKAPEKTNSKRPSLIRTLSKSKIDKDKIKKSDESKEELTTPVEKTASKKPSLMRSLSKSKIDKDKIKKPLEEKTTENKQFDNADLIEKRTQVIRNPNARAALPQSLKASLSSSLDTDKTERDSDSDKRKPGKR